VQVIRSGVGHRHGLAGAMFVVLSAVDAPAGSVCPDYVSLPSGSLFNLARLIADKGSPEAALKRIRTALAEVTAAGGCPKAEEPNACQETLAVARKAMVALEACTSTPPPREAARKNGQGPLK